MSPKKKSLKSYLLCVVGVGSSIGVAFCKDLGFKPTSALTAFKNAQKVKLQALVQDSEVLLIKGDLFNNVKNRINQLMRIKCYKGTRHHRSLPVRGQRTHTNAKAAKKLNKTRTLH